MQNLVFCNSEVSGYGNKLEDQITAVLWFKKTKQKTHPNHMEKWYYWIL